MNTLRQIGLQLFNHSANAMFSRKYSIGLPTLLILIAKAATVQAAAILPSFEFQGKIFQEDKSLNHTT
jgi:hypothetical protein